MQEKLVKRTDAAWPRSRRVGRVFAVVAITITVVSGCVSEPPGAGAVPVVFSHRGVHTPWHVGKYDPISGCEAEHIYEPTHEYIENTIASIAAAFTYGATTVEIDVRLTGDQDLVVFHDDSLDCRTDGTGPVGEHTVEELKKLDIGFGYTADDGATYPFRGRGFGLMPTLREVLIRFPEGSFLIDQKDGQPAAATVLGEILSEFPVNQQRRITYWGSDQMLSLVRESVAIDRYFPQRSEVKAWGKSALLSFGTADVPESFRGKTLAVPLWFYRVLPGSRTRIRNALHNAGCQFLIMADSPRVARVARRLPVDGVLTEHVELIGPIVLGDGFAGP